MSLSNRVRELVKKNDKLYVVARCIYNIKDPDFIRLLKGFYEESPDYTSMLAIHNGEKYSDTFVYYVQNGCEARNKKNATRQRSGFCAMMRRLLEMLNFCDFLGMKPVVEWGNTSTYYDPMMDSITENAFEYYFEPVSEIDYREIKECKNVIEANTGQGNFFMKHATSYAESYEVEQDEIEKLGYIYRKYIHLNEKTRAYIDQSVNRVLNHEKVLAVHVRGTDFNQGFKYHPVAVNAKEHLEKARELYSSGKFSKIFLATDDVNVLKLFQQEFKDSLAYYDDTLRSADHTGVHSKPSNRPLHYYKLGLEVLRDVYTLANCDALICGLSQVSFAARYVNIAMDRRFNELVILNHGMNMKNSAEAKKTKRQRLFRGGGRMFNP